MVMAMAMVMVMVSGSRIAHSRFRSALVCLLGGEVYIRKGTGGAEAVWWGDGR
jgi:hypothetical protein